MTRAETGPVSLLVTGADGRIGRALRAIWGAKTPFGVPILWSGRQSGDVPWDIGQNPPDLPGDLIVLHLAGRVSGSDQDLAQNLALTRAVCALGARHLFVMSSAAVYAPGSAPLREDMTPAPVSPYGAAKLAAEEVARQRQVAGLTILRLANLAGADALLGPVRQGPVMLDPIAGQAGGPERSYIGPRMLAQVLAALVDRAGVLPQVVNVAQQPPVAMADLLRARGQDWAFGPPRAGAVARVVLATDRLAALTDLPQTSPAALIADMVSVPGWPR